MNRNTYDEAVRKSDLEPFARLVALTYSAHCKWETGEGIYISEVGVAAETGLSKNSVTKYRRMLVEAGWLVPTGKLKTNITTHELPASIPTPVTLSVDDAEVSIPTAGRLPKSVDRQVSQMASQVSQIEGQVSQTVSQVSHVVNTNLTEPYIELTKNVTEEESDASKDESREDAAANAAAVQEEEELNMDDCTSLYNNEGSAYFNLEDVQTAIAAQYGGSDRFRAFQAQSLVNNPKWQPALVDLDERVRDALYEVFAS